MSKKPRVLVIAEAANPEWVSVPLIGWELSNALRGVCDAHIVTQIRNREAILRKGLVEDVDFTVIDSEALARPLNKAAQTLRMGKGKGWTVVTAISSLSYKYFEYLVWKKFGNQIKAGEFDVVHRVTPLSPVAISSLAAKCEAANVPFVMGPLNGGVPWPKGYGAERKREREWLSYLRGLYRLLPGRGRMLKAARAIIAGSRHTQSEFPDQAKTIWLPENGIDLSKFAKRADLPEEGPLKAVFIGRLVPYKGPDILLEAAEDLLRSGAMQLDILGDGPMHEALAATVRDKGLETSVTLHGFVEHGQVQDIVSKAHILSFPSVREFGGGVVLEAMALGIVPVIVDYAGPGELVDAATGYKVPIGPRDEIVTHFRKVLTDLAADRTALPAKAEAGFARVQTMFLWPEKARRVREVYDWVLDGGEKPDFSFGRD